MRHISDLISRTLCGLENKNIPDGDRSFAALNPETQKLINCVTCRAKLGLEPNSK